MKPKYLTLIPLSIMSHCRKELKQVVKLEFKYFAVIFPVELEISIALQVFL
jgi:hypothetical protein